MAYVFRHSGVAVTVDGGFLPDHRFSVHGRVAYGPSPSREARRQSETAALLAMIAGVLREVGRGRRRGAREGDIAVTGDRGLADAIRRLASRPGVRRASAGSTAELTAID